MQDATLTLTGGWAIFGIISIIYLCCVILQAVIVAIGKWLKKDFIKKGDNNE